MAKQSVKITVTRTRSPKGATVTKSSPGRTSIGGKGSGKSRCPTCGKYK